MKRLKNDMTDMSIMVKLPALYPNHISKPGLLELNFHLTISSNCMRFELKSLELKHQDALKEQKHLNSRLFTDHL